MSCVRRFSIPAGGFSPVLRDAHTFSYCKPSVASAGAYPASAAILKCLAAVLMSLATPRPEAYIYPVQNSLTGPPCRVSDPFWHTAKSFCAYAVAQMAKRRIARAIINTPRSGDEESESNRAFPPHSLLGFPASKSFSYYHRSARSAAADICIRSC